MKRLALSLLALPVLGCSAPPLSPRPHLGQQVDELRLAVRDSGANSSGKRTLVLLHGWCSDQSSFDDIRPALEEEHRVISFDFPGHGETVGRTSDATLEALGRETAELLASLNLERVVLIGHSMGAPVALFASAFEPERVEAIVALDSFHDLDKAIDPDQLEGLIDSFTRDFEGTMSLAVSAMFEPAEPREVAQDTLATALRVDREFALGLMASFASFEPKRRVRAAARPIFSLQSNAGPPTAVEANAKACPAGYEVEFVEQVGHFFLRTRPERTAEAIFGFLSELDKRSGD